MSDSQMQLNSHQKEPGGGGSGPVLASTPAEKQKAARSIELHIVPDTRRAGDLADDSTAAAVRAFAAKDACGWDTSGALSKAHTTWGNQVTALISRLNGERDALRAADSLLGTTDTGVGAKAARVQSTLDAY